MSFIKGVVITDLEVRGKIIVNECTVQRVEIIRGQYKEFEFKLYKANGDPFSLVGRDANSIKARFLQDDNSEVEFSEAASGSEITIVSEALGHCRVLMSAAKTATIELGLNQTAQIEVLFSTKPTIVQLPAVFCVLKRIGE